MKKCILFVLLLGLFLSMAPFSARAIAYIEKVELEDLEVPLAGAKPDTSVTMRTAGYVVYSLEWYDVTADRYLNSGETFTADHVYRVVIWLEAKEDFEFQYTNSYTPNVAAKINGKTAHVNKAYEYNAWAMVEVCYTFEPTPSNWIHSVNIQLDGLVRDGNVLCAPEDGPIPYTIQSASADISVYPQLNANRYHPDGFRWSDLTSDVVKSNGDHFKGGREYYVHIAVHPNSGGFSDNLEVTINGVSATIKAHGQSYAEVGVSVTCFGGIVGSDIRPVVILPKDGNYPDYAATYAYPQCKHIDYASVDGWYDVETGNRITSQDPFVGGKQYRVVICCTASYPYKFARDANDKMQYSPQITGWDVDSYSFGYDDYRGRELIYISKTFTAETRDHVCTAGAWQCDDSGHKNYCTTCGVALAGGAHWSNGDATCTHGKLCAVCGYEMTPPTETHTPDTSKWTACGNLYHAHLCKLCGAHCNAQDHVPGAAATETTPLVCTVCGYILQPAKNHVHQLTHLSYVAPTCFATGTTEHYVCSGCSTLFADANGTEPLKESVIIPYLTHEISDDWDMDEDFHWRTCKLCQTLLEETKMVHELQNGKCATCGYENGTVPTQITEAATTEASPNEPDPTEAVFTEGSPEDSQEQPHRKTDWVPIALMASVCFAAAITATVIFLKKKK